MESCATSSRRICPRCPSRCGIAIVTPSPGPAAARSSFGGPVFRRTQAGLPILLPYDPHGLPEQVRHRHRDTAPWTSRRALFVWWASVPKNAGRIKPPANTTSRSWMMGLLLYEDPED